MSPTLENLRRCSVAVDMGASRTRVYVKGSGLIVDAPSAVAVNTLSGTLIAVGEAAERMDGRTPPHIRVARPVAGGTVVDIEMAQRMLRALVGTKLRGLRRRRALVRAAAVVPHDADPLARRAVVETLTGVGARRVELVDSPTAAAVGSGLPVELPEATMILVCGAASTQVAVLSLGAIVASDTVRLGGDTVHHAVVQHLRNQHELLLPSDAVRPLQLALAGGDPTAVPSTPSASSGQSPQTKEQAKEQAKEHAKHTKQSKQIDPTNQVAEVIGRDIVSGLARSVSIDPEDIRTAVALPLANLSDSIRSVLLDCPPDLVADLAERGMVLAGGSAVLPGLDARIRQTTGMNVHIAEEPELCAVNGLAEMVEGRVSPLCVGGGVRG